MAARFYVGTAGWSYLKWDREFYPKATGPEEKLAFYASCFNAVELNNSFYHVPSPGQVADWETRTPANFRFAVKASRYITHTKKLKDAAETLPHFLDALGMQQKPGPIFFQLPPAFSLNLERMNAFLAQLQPGRCYAIELRDPSWHNGSVYTLLKQYNVAFCLFDTPEGISPRFLTADFAYVRLRGREGPGLAAFLNEWQDWLSGNTKEAYVFFDNREEKRLAFGNALVFREMTKKAGLT